MFNGAGSSYLAFGLGIQGFIFFSLVSVLLFIFLFVYLLTSDLKILFVSCVMNDAYTGDVMDDVYQVHSLRYDNSSM